jgi:hypothetical protein
MPTVKYHYPHNRSDYGVKGRDFGNQLWDQKEPGGEFDWGGTFVKR